MGEEVTILLKAAAVEAFSEGHVVAVDCIGTVATLIGYQAAVQAACSAMPLAQIAGIM
jgi:hypothetical protein